MSSTIEVFCCYAREDQPMLLQLKKHLLPLQRQGLITLWSDTDLDAGDLWESLLHEHLESSDIILLLISPDFMASDYCYSTEMSRALQRHETGSAYVIPILLRSIYLKGAPFAKIQLLPKDSLPIQNWQYADDAFSAITETISQIVEKLKTQKAFLKQKSQQVLVPEHQQNHALAAENRNQHVVSTPPTSVIAQLVEKALDSLSASTATLSVPPKPTPVLSSPTPVPASPKPVSVPTVSVSSLSAASITPVSTLDPSRLVLKQVLSGHTSSVKSIAFSANGKILASASKDTSIKLWKIPSGYNSQTLQEHTGSVRSIVINSNGGHLASASNDGTIKIWKFSSSERSVIKLNIPENEVPTNLALSSDSKLLVSAGYNHPITIWEFPSGKQLNTINKYKSSVTYLAIDPTSKLLAVALKDKVVRLWEIPLGLQVQSSVEHESNITGLAISANGAFLASASKDKTIRLSKFPSCEPIQTIQHPNLITCIAFSPDNRFLACGSEHGTITFWQLPGGRLLHTLSGHAGSVMTLAFNLQNTFLASGGADNVIKLWSMLD